MNNRRVRSENAFYCAKYSSAQQHYTSCITHGDKKYHHIG